MSTPNVWAAQEDNIIMVLFLFGPAAAFDLKTISFTFASHLPFC